MTKLRITKTSKSYCDLGFDYLTLTPAQLSWYRKLCAQAAVNDRLAKAVNGGPMPAYWSKIKVKEPTSKVPVKEPAPARRTSPLLVVSAEVKPSCKKLILSTWAPFPRIANVRNFKVTVGEIDNIFKAHGMDKRQPPTLDFEPYRNQRMLRYAAFTILRLRKLKSDKLYWGTCHAIMSRSVVFTLMAIGKSFPRYHRELPLNLVMKLALGAMEIARSNSTCLDLKRIWIPKPNGKLRPLGVPTPVWRIHLTMVSWFLITRFNRWVPSWQHGFRPFKGTLTAWREVLTKMIDVKYIYEFDLKGFFDSVDVNKVLNWLQEAKGLSKDLRHRLEAMSIVPRISFKSLAEEDQPKEGDPTLRKISPTFVKGNLGLLKNLSQEEMEELGPDADAWVDEEDGPEGYEAWIPLPEGEEPRQGDNSPGWYLPTGFPQGANISPFLSIVQLAMGAKAQFAQLLMYADDGLFYSDNQFTAEEVAQYFQAKGLTIAPEKSGWVKQAGVWEKSLKFLGLEFLGPENELWSSTRKGAKLEFTKHGLIKDLKQAQDLEPADGITGQHGLETYVVWAPGQARYLHKTKLEAQQRLAGLPPLGSASWKIGRVDADDLMLTEDVDYQFTWASMAKSTIWGLIQNRMYNGEWNSEVEQNFNLTYRSKSWVGVRGWKEASKVNEILTFANSTSFAIHDIASLIMRVRKNKTYKTAYKAGQMTLEELNKARKRIGYPPMGAGYTKVLAIRNASFYAKVKLYQEAKTAPGRNYVRPPSNLTMLARLKYDRECNSGTYYYGRGI